jgi:hypothetical protein
MGEGQVHEERLVIPYITHFCNQFSAGLTLAAWKYMQIIFKMITMETNIDTMDVLPNFRDQIPETHFSTIEKMMTKYKLAKLAPLSFTIKKASDALPFYRALFSSLGFGVNSIICDLALEEETSNNFFWHTANNLNEFIMGIHQIYALFSIYLYLERKQPRMNFTLAFPGIDSLGMNREDSTLDPKIINEALIIANIENLKKEHQLVERKLEEFQKAFSERIGEIEKYLSRNPKEISKGYSIKELKELNKLSFSFKPLKTVEEILEKTLIEYEKLITQINPDLDKAKDAAQQFLEKKIDEKKLEKILKNRGFLDKTRGNFEKMIYKMQDEIKKKYRDIPEVVEKQFKNLSKDISKEYIQACSFLNINRKNLGKGESNLIPDPSSTIVKLQSSINQKFTKERFLTKEKLGIYYFRAKNRTLPKDLRDQISNSLVHRKSYPFLKEATELLKKNPSMDIYRSYTVVLEEHAKEFINTLFDDAGKIVGKNVLKTDMDIFFVERNKIPIPSLELGLVSSVEATKSLQSLLGSKVIVHEERTEDKGKIFRVFAVIPDFGCDLKPLKRVWTSKDWTLKKVILFFSWYSLLNRNRFYVNLLRLGTDMYSDRVKDSLDEIFNDIGKEIISN